MRTALLLCLAPALAVASGKTTITAILDAKLRADSSSGFPCVIQGTVTATLSRTEFYLQDRSSGVRVASEPYELRAGKRLEVDGWIYLADSGEFRMNARQVWHLAHKPPPAPSLITLAAALSGAYQGRLVAVRGSVLSVDFGEEFDTISIQSGRCSLRVFYPAAHAAKSVFEPLYPGMEVAVTGISVPPTAAPEFDGYQVRLRSPSDFSIRRSADAGRPPPLPWAVSLATMLLAGVAAWIRSGRPRRAPAASQVK